MKLKRILTVFVLSIGLLVVYGKLSFQPSTARSQDFSLPTCTPNAQGTVNYDVSVQTGQTGFYFGDAAGCINRPVIETWGVTQNPDEMGLPQFAQSKVVPVEPPPAGSTNLYRVTYKVKEVFTVTWTLDWLHTLPQGTTVDPREVLITVTKSSGSSLISHFAGNIRLLQISPTMTLATTHLEISAPEVNQTKLADIVSEIINRLRVGSPNYTTLKSPSNIDFE
jgi:hypothetical protein